MKKYWLFVCLLGCNYLFSQSNVLDGNWYSNGVVRIEGSTNNYLGEMKLKQKGRNVTGEFNYYFRDSLFKTKIEGIFDMNSRYMIIKSFPIMLHSSTSTKTGVDCGMNGEYLLRISRVGSFLAGKFMADEAYKYTCPEIAFVFEKNNDSISPIEEAKQESIVQKAKDTTASDPIVAVTQQQFNDRAKDFFKELTVESKSVDIELYDNGAIDYDSISVFLNNKLVLKKTMLSHRAIKLTLPIDDSLPFNEIGMFANNEGLIPPNTATLILIDGDNRYEMEMNSSLNRTATLKLIRKRK